MLKIHKERFNKNLLKYLYFCTFLLGLASAFILYLESDYFKEATKSENITPFFLIAYAVALALVLNWHHLIRIFGKFRVFVSALSVKLLASFLLSLAPVSSWSIWLLVLYIIFSVLTWLNIDLLIESCSVDKKTGKIRGAHLTIMNLGYLFAPFFAGLLVSQYGFQAAFQVNAVFLAAILIISIVKFQKIDHRPIKNTLLLDLVRKVFQRKNVMKIYYVSFLLEFFYALMIIYTPLYLLDLGFDWFQIGKIFTIMLIPFVLFQYPAGYLADAKYEEKDMMAGALFILAVSTMAIYFIGSKSALVWAFVLFCTRIGASLIEVLRDSYFYKRIDQTDVDITDFFRTVRPIAYIIGALIAAPIVYIFHIKLIFVIIGIATLTGIPVSLSLASSRVPSQIVKN